MNIPLDEVIYFDCITTHPTTGAATDADSTPTFEVFEEATDTDIGVGGNLTKRTSKTGNYRGSFTLSAANGFEVGKWYNVIGSATVNSIAGKAVLKNFRVVAAEAIAGKPKVDVDGWLGTAPETPDTAGVPNVNMVYLNNSGVTVDNIGNVFGTDFATNYDDTNNRWLVDVRMISGDATAADNAEAFFDGTGYAGTGNVIPLVTTTTNLTNAAGAGDLTSTMKTSVQTAANAALVALNLDHLFAVADPGGAVVDNSFWAKLHSKSATADYTSYANTTDSLEALRDRGDAAWITATGFSTLDAAGVRTAIGLASANLDTQIGTLATAANLATVAGYLDTEIAAILADTNELQTDWANGGRLDLLLDGCATPSQVNAEVLDVINVDTLIDGKTIKEAVRAIAATTTAKVSGAGTGTEVFVGMDGTTVRVTATVDASGNRTAVVYG